MPHTVNTEFRHIMRDIANALRQFGGAFETSAAGSEGRYISSGLVNYGYGEPADLEASRYIYDLVNQRQYRINTYHPETATAKIYFHGDLEVPASRSFWVFRAPPIEFAEAVRLAVQRMGRAQLAVPEYAEYSVPENLTEEQRQTEIEAGRTPRPEFTMELDDIGEIDRIEVVGGVYQGAILRQEHWAWDSQRHLLRYHKAAWIVGCTIRIYGEVLNPGLETNWDLVDNPLELANHTLTMLSDNERTALVFTGADQWLRSTFFGSSPEELNKVQRTARSFRNRAAEILSVAPPVLTP